MVKLIVSDLDGTMLHDHAVTLNPEYFRTIQQLKKNGILFCAASGRQYSSMRTLFAPIQEDILYIAENGAEIIWKGEVIFSQPMTMEASRQLVLDTRAIPGAESMYCTADTAYFEAADQKVLRLMRDEFHFHCTVVDDLLKLEVPCLKFSLYLENHVDQITSEYFVPKWKRTHEAACGGKYFMDVMEKGVNKGTALKKIQQRWGIAKAETAAFGDNHNDLEMLEEAGLCFAVANARTKVKQAANRILESNNQDGVLHMMKQMLWSHDFETRHP